MKTISRYIMTLALLLTAVTGAWADDAYEEFTTADESMTQLEFTGEHIKITGTDIDIDGLEILSDYPVTISALNGKVITKVELTVSAIDYWDNTYVITSTPNATIEGTYAVGQKFTITPTGANPSEITLSANVDMTTAYIQAKNWKVYYADASASSGPKVAWNPSTKTGTFSMPGSDVVLTPIYAKAAAFATTGTEPEVKTLLPEAAEGVIAGTDASLIAEGTGIVAFAAASTEVTQGTLMYAVGTSATQAPDLTAFSATVPTAKNVADDGADVYVWYYIKGADTPDGQQATEENTFNDSEPACLTVTVLTNKFDIQFNAANANTIEAGKATVTVGGTAATVTEGKLEGVKMGTEVKLKANTGYKFRKVEVKKGGPATLAEATAEDLGKVVCAAGHLHDAKTAVPDGCTAVGILGKVTETGHGLIIALKNATNQNWNTINGWTSASYAGTTLKVLPDDAARGNLTSYTTLGSTAVSNWAVASYEGYKAIFVNLGSTKGNNNGKTYDSNVNAFITTGVGGTAISGAYWSATARANDIAWYFDSDYWSSNFKTYSVYVRPVLGF